MVKEKKYIVFHIKTGPQLSRIVGWPRYYHREQSVRKGLWQAIKAMLF